MTKSLECFVLVLTLASAPRALGDPCQDADTLAGQMGTTTPGSPDRNQLVTQLSRQTLLCREQKCEGGDADSCYNASLTLANSGDFGQSRVYDHKACAAGRKMSCSALEAAKPALATSNDILTHAKDRCSQGFARDCEFAGSLLFRDGDISGAERFYETACAGKYGKGCANEAVCAAKQSDSAKATELLQKGCKLGFATACHRSPAALETIW